MKETLPFVISILIGFLIGIEREKNHSPSGSMGVRTFTLIAILGAVAGWVKEPWFAGLLGAFALGLILVAYLRETQPEKNPDLGLTTEVAAGLVFALSFTSHKSPALSAILSCLVAMLLFWKAPLHRFTAKVKRSELEAAVIILLIGASVLSVLEDKTIDPWGLFNPRKFGLVVLILAVLEFSSYLAVKFLGSVRSTLLVGFFAGIVSSTALLLTVCKSAKAKPTAWRQQVAMATTGKLSSLLELLVIVGVASPQLFAPLTLMLLGVFLLGTGAIVWLMRTGPVDEPALKLSSPLDLKGVLRLALFLVLILAAVAAAERHVGEMGRNAAVLFAGILELHGGSLAAATLFEQGQIDARSTLFTIGLAVLSSFLAKIVIAVALTSGRFRLGFAALFASLSTAVLAGLALIKAF